MRTIAHKGVFMLLDIKNYEKDTDIKYLGYFDIQEINNYFKGKNSIFYYDSSDSFLDCEAHFIVGNIL